MKNISAIFRMSLLSIFFITLIAIGHFANLEIDVLQVDAQSSASLKFDPATVSPGLGSQFDVNVIIDTGGAEVLSSDSYIIFDATKIQPVSVQNGTFFPSTTSTIQSSSLVLRGIVTEPASFRKGTGILATVTFKIIQTGASAMSFYCNTNAGDTSKIIQNGIDAQNIINCSANGTLTISSGNSGNSPTPNTTITSGCPNPGSNIDKPTPRPTKVGKKDRDGKDDDGKDDDGIDDDGHDDDGKDDDCQDGIDDDGKDDDGRDDDGIDDDGIDDDDKEDVIDKNATQSAGLVRKLTMPIIIAAAILVAVAALALRRSDN